ncbi:unnamed protein product, partial [Choristocarpus tenellus]
HSGRTGGATRLATMGILELVIQRKGRWKSSVLMVYVRANQRDPVWVLKGLIESRKDWVQPG